MEYVIEMNNISKYFPGIKANDNITLQLEKGTIHALLGENGAGKSTLMSVLFGLYQPEEGEIYVRGEKIQINNPNIATKLGIGMVHQHFKLVECFSVLENILLGDEPKGTFGRIDFAKGRKKIEKISKEYNLDVDLDAKISNITVGMQQRVEILKMLYRDAEILIFDEPTAVLTPQEIDGLMEVMRNLASEGKSIIIITHKLKEIKAVASKCTVIRKGKGISTVDVATTTIQEMADLMVGRNVSFKQEKAEANPKGVTFEVQELNQTNEKGLKSLKDVSFTIRSGEILGIAGIEGNGQSELVKVITGLMTNYTGKILLNGEDISTKSIREKTLSGIGHIPEDRHKYGLVLDYSLENNMALQTYFKEPLSKGGILNKSEIREQSNKIIDRFDVRSGEGSKTIARSMSGGNQQKAIIGREVLRNPDLLIATQPTRGLDVGAIEFIHKELLQCRDSGKAVLLVSLELDEILNLSDRILVMYEGEIVGELNAKETNEQEIGLYMSGSKGGKSNA
ncbi:MAG: ABC transporter ATP-binding protein [Lachnospirales bacterium]